MEKIEMMGFPREHKYPPKLQNRIFKDEKIVAVEREAGANIASILCRKEDMSFYIYDIKPNMVLSKPIHRFKFTFMYKKAINRLFKISAEEYIVLNGDQIYALVVDNEGNTFISVYRNFEFPTNYTISYDRKTLIAIYNSSCWKLSIADLLAGKDTIEKEEICSVEVSTKFVVETSQGKIVEFANHNPNYLGKNIYIWGWEPIAYEIADDGTKQKKECIKYDHEKFFTADGRTLIVEKFNGMINIICGDESLDYFETKKASTMESCIFIEKENGIYIFTPARERLVFIPNILRKRKRN